MEINENFYTFDFETTKPIVKTIYENGEEKRETIKHSEIYLAGYKGKNVLFDTIDKYEFFNKLYMFEENADFWAINGAKFDDHFFYEMISLYNMRNADDVANEAKLELEVIEGELKFSPNDKQLLKLRTEWKWRIRNKNFPNTYNILLDESKKILSLSFNLNQYNKKYKKVTVDKHSVYLKAYYKITLRDLVMLFPSSAYGYGEVLAKEYAKDIFTGDLKDPKYIAKYEEGLKLYGKLEGAITYNKLETYRNREEYENDGLEREYFIRDLEIPYNFITLMNEKFPMNTWELTSASFAYNTWMKQIGDKLIDKLVEGKMLRKFEKDDFIIYYTTKPIQKRIEGYNAKYKKFKHYTTEEMKKVLYSMYFNSDWLQWENEEGEYAFRHVYKAYNGGLVGTNPFYKGVLLSTELLKNNHKSIVDVYDINSSFPSQMIKHNLPFGEPYNVLHTREDGTTYRTFGDGGEEYSKKIYKITIYGTYTNHTGLPFLWNEIQGKNNVHINVNNRIQDILEELSTSRRSYDKTLVGDVFGRTFILTDIEFERFNKYYTPDNENSFVHSEVLFSFKSIKGDTLFSFFVDYFYNMKDEAKKSGDHVSYFISKIMLNSLYGKFGTNPVLVSTDYSYNDITGEYEFIKTERIQTKFYMPIALWVTAYGRMQLVDAVGDYYKYLVQWDTDSLMIISSKAHYITQNMELDDFKLGAWDLEAQTFEFLGRRAKQYFGHYMEKGKVKTKEAFAGMRFKNDKWFYNNRTFEHYIKGRTIRNQLVSEKHLNGIDLIDIDKTLKPIWEYPTNADDWFSNETEYYEYYNEHLQEVIAVIN